MIKPLILLLAFSAGAAIAQAEDAEHRADRERTIELNERARAAVARRDRGNQAVRDGNRAAHERYERQLADWRARVAACRSGDYRACDDRY